MNEKWFNELKAAAREYIRTEKILLAHPQSWRSCHPDPDTVEGQTYLAHLNCFQRAEASLWRLTDVEYDYKDPYLACFNWRDCKVQSRKCTYFININQPNAASRLMTALEDAEYCLMAALGLENEYKSQSEYIKEAFPNLKKE